MKQPLDHIQRPLLPWRDASDSITECGHDASKVPTITRKEFFDRLTEYGQQRTALFTCMTCSDTAKRHPTWEEDPRGALLREIEWEYRWRKVEREHRLKDELLAIQILIENNRDEFDGLLSMSMQRQEWQARKKEKAQGKVKSPHVWYPIKE